MSVWRQKGCSWLPFKQTCNEYLYLNIIEMNATVLWGPEHGSPRTRSRFSESQTRAQFSENISTFSMCSELTPRAPVPDNRTPQLMQPCSSYKNDFKKIIERQLSNCPPSHQRETASWQELCHQRCLDQHKGLVVSISPCWWISNIINDNNQINQW